LPKGWSDRIRSAVIHAISLAHFSLTSTRSWAANSWNARIRLKAENDRLRQELALVRKEMRIKDSRMLRIPAHRRPHYSPTERLAILELRAARAWSLSQTARQLLVTTATVASWMSRLNEEGPRAIVQIPVPVNKFPDLVTYVVQRLKVTCPTMGKAKIAQVLCRVGLHLGVTTVARKLEKELPHPFVATIKAAIARPLRTSRPNQVWNVDLTTVPGLLDLVASVCLASVLAFLLVGCRRRGSLFESAARGRGL